MMAAFELLPHLSPSTNPAATATTVYNPHPRQSHDSDSDESPPLTKWTEGLTILECSAERYTSHVVRNTNPKVMRIEEGIPLGTILKVPASNRRLTERLVRYLVCNIGSTQRRTRNT